MGDVFPMGNQALVELAGEQGDAVRSGVMAEEVAGEAHLPAATGHQNAQIQPRPLLDGLRPGGLETGEGNRHHGPSSEVRLY
jgi:hypothetical protein